MYDCPKLFTKSFGRTWRQLMRKNVDSKDSRRQRLSLEKMASFVKWSKNQGGVKTAL